MAVKKQAAAAGGRQASYTARNRAALIESAQEVLAEIGPAATIEQLATHAQVSPTTIYKYFDNKDLLFKEALGQMWKDWVTWSEAGRGQAQTLEEFLTSGRRIFRVKKTHPNFSKVILNTINDPQYIIAAVSGPAYQVMKSLSQKGLVASEDFDQRFALFASALAAILTAVLVKDLPTSEADKSLGIALSLFGISAVKAQKLVSTPLPNLKV